MKKIEEDYFAGLKQHIVETKKETEISEDIKKGL